MQVFKWQLLLISSGFKLFNLCGSLEGTRSDIERMKCAETKLKQSVKRVEMKLVVCLRNPKVA